MKYPDLRAAPLLAFLAHASWHQKCHSFTAHSCNASCLVPKAMVGMRCSGALLATGKRCRFHATPYCNPPPPATQNSLLSTPPDSSPPLSVALPPALQPPSHHEQVWASGGRWRVCSFELTAQTIQHHPQRTSLCPLLARHHHWPWWSNRLSCRQERGIGIPQRSGWGSTSRGHATTQVGAVLLPACWLTIQGKLPGRGASQARWQAGLAVLVLASLLRLEASRLSACLEKLGQAAGCANRLARVNGSVW